MYVLIGRPFFGYILFWSIYRRIIHHYLLMLAFIWPLAFDKDYIRIKKVPAPDDEATLLP